jgi:SAM-dependent methyltransferase
MDDEDLQRRLRMVTAAQLPVEGWIAGAHALALLHGALQAGMLDAMRTPRSAIAVAEACGIDPERAADICVALAAHGVVRQDGDAYRLTDDFALLMSSDPVRPLSRVVARAVAEAHRFETLPRTDVSYAASSPAELLAFAQGDSPDPASPLRPVLSFINPPEFRAPFEAGARCLELGCGIGGALCAILTTFPRVTAVGVELRAELLDVARRRAEALGVADRVEWRHGDARDVTDEAAFDRVSWSQYYFPAETRAATLAAAFRALKPGGHLLVSMLPDPPAATDGQSPADRAYALSRVLYRAWDVPIRTPDELRAEVEAAGFAFVRFIGNPPRRRLLARRPPA